MNRVIWSAPAISDLVKIRAYITGFNPIADRSMVEKLLAAGEGLAAFPHKGRSVGDGVREWSLVHPYVIRYEIVGDVVHVLRVRHSKQKYW